MQDYRSIVDFARRIARQTYGGMKLRMAARPVRVLQQGKGASSAQAFTGSGFTVQGYLNRELRISEP